MKYLNCTLSFRNMAATFYTQIFIRLFDLIADPFQDADSSNTGGKETLIHIRIQQRNGRKTLTTVQGLSSEYDFKKIVKACKKVKTIQANL